MPSDVVHALPIDSSGGGVGRRRWLLTLRWLWLTFPPAATRPIEPLAFAGDRRVCCFKRCQGGGRRYLRRPWLGQPRGAALLAEPANEGAGVLRILLVEDQDEGRAMLAEFLALAGFEVRTAENGLQALAVARERQSDIILMDLAMPILDGWAATRALKADPATRLIPVWAISAFSDGRAAQQARSAGCSEVLTKPVDPHGLVRRLQEFDAGREPWHATDAGLRSVRGSSGARGT